MMTGMPRMKPLPDYGEHMLLEEFVRAVLVGGYTNWDGSGYYATATEMSHEHLAIPSEIFQDKIDRSFTHVVWFNK